MNRKILLIAALIIALVGFLLSKHVIPASQAQKGSSLPSVKVAQVLSRDIDNTAVFTGKLEAVNHVELRPRVSGYVEAAPFEEGAMVHKGEVLFRIDSRPYRAEVDRLSAKLAQARAQLKLARANAERGQHLLQQHALSKEEADRLNTAATTAQAQVHSTRAALETAQLNLDFTAVRSPIDGRVSRILVTPGNLVTSSSVLTRIVTMKPIYAVFQVDERHYLKFARLRRSADKMPEVDMGLTDEKAFPHHGRINFVDNEVQSRSGTIRMRAVFANNDGFYTPGLYVRIRLHNGERRPRILIDDRAVGTDLNNRFVYVIDAQNKVAYRRVVTGPIFAGLRVIDNGLQPEDRIIVSGLQRVQPGMQVMPATVPMQANLDSQDRALLAAAQKQDSNSELADASVKPAQH